MKRNGSEAEPARETRQTRRGSHDACRNLRLVHRGLRYSRSERREGAARRTARVTTEEMSDRDRPRWSMVGVMFVDALNVAPG
jgi:hypothetical protein